MASSRLHLPVTSRLLHCEPATAGAPGTTVGRRPGRTVVTPHTRSPGMWCQADRQKLWGLQKGPVSSWSWTADCGWAKPSAPALGLFPQLSCARGGRGVMALPGEPPLAPCGWRRLVLHPACPGALCLYALLSASERRSCADHSAASPFPARGWPFRSSSSSQELQALWRAEAGAWSPGNQCQLICSGAAASAW